MTTRMTRFALLLSAVALATPALAQETAAPEESAPAETSEPAAEGTETTETETGTDAEAEGAAEGPASDLDMGTPVGEPPAEMEAGAPYLREEHGDWQIRCINNPEGADPCQMYQLLSDQDGNPVAEIAMFPLPAGGRAAAGANIVAPLETFLPAQLTMSVDGGQPRKYPFTFCAGRPFSPFLSSGCVSRVGFEQGAIDQFKRGAAATIILVPAIDPEQTIELTVSLTGFTAAYESQTVPAPAE